MGCRCQGRLRYSGTNLCRVQICFEMWKFVDGKNERSGMKLVLRSKLFWWEFLHEMLFFYAKFVDSFVFLFCVFVVFLQYDLSELHELGRIRHFGSVFFLLGLRISGRVRCFSKNTGRCEQNEFRYCMHAILFFSSKELQCV